jgi:hypothetical protein
VVVAVYFVYTKKYRYILVALVLFAVLIAVLPQDRIDTFLESKVTGELQAAEQGDIGAIGAGRMAIVLLAAEWLLDKMSIFQILFGLGTAQSNMLHILAIGYYAYAHVQLVALVIDYGLIGTLLFITVFQRIFVQKSRQLAEDPSVTNIISISVLVMVLSKFFYAMPLQDGATSALVVFWLGALR